MGRPQNTKGKTRPLEKHEVKRLIAACNMSRHPLRNETLVKFMLYTGCRVSEATSLLVKDVFSGREILPSVQFKETKNKKSRIIPMSSRLAHCLGLYLDNSHTEPESPLFKSQKGSALHPTYASQLIKNLLIEAGLEDAKGSHCLRKTAMVNLLDAGHSLATIKEVGGWTQISTCNYYLSSNINKVSQAMDSLKF
jgi:integrase/recombinase XerD